MLSEKEEQEAMALLKDPNLLDRILQDFETCGVVGEETNKLVGYLATVSRKLDKPLGVVIQSSSSAGKSWLMESILSFVPKEESVKYSAMTGQSLYYLGETDLNHKVLAVVEGEGAERASYSLKLLLSEGELSIASTGKDATGKLETKEYRIEAKIMLFVTTTSIDVDEELLNRCIVLTVDESREQTQAIQKLQRKMRTLKGYEKKMQKSYIGKLHNNIQRLLKPYPIINPYSESLTFLDTQTRTRRDQEKYFTLIDSIALLFQHQRALKKGVINGKRTQYIEVTLQDIEIANKLACEVFGKTLDELPPQTRNLLTLIEEMVDKQCKKQKIERCDYRFSRRQVREYCNWNNTRLIKHLMRLEEFEYIIPHRGGRGQTFHYELLYNGNGKDGMLFFNGLMDVGKLKQKYEYDRNLTPQIVNFTPPLHPQNTPKSPPLHPIRHASKQSDDNAFQSSIIEMSQKTLLESKNNNGVLGGGHTYKSRLRLSIEYALLDKAYKKFAAKKEMAFSELPVINKTRALEANH